MRKLLSTFLILLTLATTSIAQDTNEYSLILIKKGTTFSLGGRFPLTSDANAAGYGITNIGYLCMSGSDTKVVGLQTASVGNALSAGLTNFAINGQLGSVTGKVSYFTLPSADLGSIRVEIDDLRLANSISAFSSFGKETALSYGTPYGRQSLFPTITDDVGTSVESQYSTNGQWTIGRTNRLSPSFVSYTGISGGLGRQAGGFATLNNRMYYVAGVAGGSYYQDTFVYDPSTGIWTTSQALPRKAIFAGCAVAGGNLYIIGGYNQVSVSTNVLKYSDVTSNWVDIGNSPTADTGHMYPIVAATINSNIYLLTGGNPSQLYTYSTISNQWTRLADAPRQIYLGGLAVLNGELYAVSGLYVSTVTNTAYKYNLVTTNWISIPPMPAGRMSGTLAAYRGMLLYMGGMATNGGSSMGDVFLYDPVSQTWSVSSVKLPSLSQGSGATILNGSLKFFEANTSVGYSTNVFQIDSNNFNMTASSLISVSTVTPFNCKRAFMTQWVTPTNIFTVADNGIDYTNAIYGTDWSNSISADGGTNWITITNMQPTVSIGLTNGYYGLVTNGLNGSNLMQRIGCNSNTSIRVRGWSRFGGF